jgi:2-phospho-L-lactate guanylyltransferase
VAKGGVWGIVPVKSLDEAKGRLAPALSPAERRQLSWDLLLHTCEVLQATAGLANLMLVSRDPEVLALAGRFGAQGLAEQAAGGLNAALQQATAAVQQAGAADLLIVPVDLPLLQPADLELVVELLHAADVDSPAVVAAPDRHRDGTNLLALRPAGCLRYQYGPNSFERHRTQCLQAGIPFHSVEHRRMALDIDHPADLALLGESAWR